MSFSYEGWGACSSCNTRRISGILAHPADQAPPTCSDAIGSSPSELDGPTYLSELGTPTWHILIPEGPKKNPAWQRNARRGFSLFKMGLGRLEPEAPQGPETTEDGPEGHRRSTTDLTLIRPPSIEPNPNKMP